MRELNNYYLTNYGAIYFGQEAFCNKIEDDFLIVVPPHKLLDFYNLEIAIKEIDDIKKYAWVIKRSALVETIYNKDLEFPTTNIESWNSDETSKYFFIFGAGASAFGIKGDKKTGIINPPLGNELFHDKYESIYNEFEGVKLSLHYLNEENLDIESIFEDEWIEIENFANENLIQRHISIQLYISKLLKQASHDFCYNYQGKTLFEPMFDHLSRKRFPEKTKSTNFNNQKNFQYTFISFNQDTILENYIGKYFNTSFKTMDDYCKGIETDFNFFKPHGSHNWGWKFQNLDKLKESLATDLFNDNVNYYDLYFKLLGNPSAMIDYNSYGQNVRLDENGLGRFSINKNNMEIYPANSNSYFPSLLIPYKGKDEFIMPSRAFWGMESKIAEAEKLIIIGWKGKEDGFNKILNQKGNKIKEIVIEGVK
jgi:hypothetical protein